VLAPVDAAGRAAASWDLPGESIGEKRERIAEVMSRTAREFMAKERAACPISRLFPRWPRLSPVRHGWGIMSSFAGIAQSQDTSLAVVAPGIAEALRRPPTARGAFPPRSAITASARRFSRVGQNVSHYIEDAALAHVSAVRSRRTRGRLRNGAPLPLKKQRRSYQPLADINVTPLVDVMLVLLIIFMITAPLLAKGVKVNLPQAKAAQPLNQKDPIIVTIGKDGKISLGSDVTTIEALVDGVRTLMATISPRRSCARRQRRGLRRSREGDGRLASNGITHIAIMTNSASRPTPRDRIRRWLPPRRPRRLPLPRRLRPPLPRLLHLRGGRGNDRDSVLLGTPGRAAAGQPSFPPVKPRWLGPAATVAVALAHAGLAVFLMTVAIEKVTPLES